MYSFFVLGLIPGTNFQITFQVWLDSLLLVIELAGATWLYRRHREEFARYIPLTGQRSSNAYRYTLTRLKAFVITQMAAWENFNLVPPA